MMAKERTEVPVFGWWLVFVYPTLASIHSWHCTYQFSTVQFSSTCCVLSSHLHTHFQTQRAHCAWDMRWPLRAARLPGHILSRGFPWPVKKTNKKKKRRWWLMSPGGWGVSMDTHRDGGITGKEKEKQERKQDNVAQCVNKSCMISALCYI